MIIVDILTVIAQVFICLLIFAEILCEIRTRKYQKIWNEKKTFYLKVKPSMSNAELCEQYVMFCKRNECKVDF